MRTHATATTLVSLLGAGALAGCPGHDLTAVELRQHREGLKEIPINLSRAIDILFVIDDSSSMRQEQASLRANFPVFMDVLAQTAGGLPDLRIGVVSSDLGIGGHAHGACSGDGDGGAFRLGATDGALLTDGRRFITTEPPNYVSTLEAQFSAMADLGTSGCGFEQHLASMRAALSSDVGADFLRPDAYLAVIIIADEDDCSATAAGAAALFDPGEDAEDAALGFFTSFRCWEHGVVCHDDDPAPREVPTDGSPSARVDCAPRDDSPYVAQVATYVDFLKGLKADPRHVLVAGIVGDPAPVRVQRIDGPDGDGDLEHTLMAACSTASGDAAPSTRLTAFLDGFPNRNVFQSICQEDLAGALDQIGADIGDRFLTPCLEGDLVDTDLAIDGVQPDCRVSDVQRLGTADAVERSLPSCATSGGATPCYTIAPDEQCADEPFTTGLSITVDHGGATELPDTTRVVRCRVE